MKLLLIVDTIDNGGVGVTLRNLMQYINLSKFTIDIISIDRKTEYERYLPRTVRVRHMPTYLLARHTNKYVRYFYVLIRELCPKWLIRKVFIRNTYDLAIELKGVNLSLLTALQCPKVLWSFKDYSPVTNPLMKKNMEIHERTIRGGIRKWFFIHNVKKVNGVVCSSDACRDAFIAKWKLPKNKVTILHDVLDTKAIIKKSKERIPYTKPDKFTFCCMSRIAEGKGIERLLECVSELNREGYVFQLNIVGGGDTLEEMIALARGLALDNVVFFGNQDNPYPYVLASDVFVYPSETEAYGLATCEALILQMPIITTRTASVPEIFNQGEYGIVVDSSQKAILEGMRMVLTDKSLLEKYHRKAQERLSYFNDLERIQNIEQYFQSYNTV